MLTDETSFSSEPCSQGPGTVAIRTVLLDREQ